MILEETHRSNKRQSPTISQYMDTMIRIMKFYYPDIPEAEMEKLLDYSIDKRYKRTVATVSNNYVKRNKDMTLLQIADYIAERQPIVTAYGTMFKNHANSVNPMATVVQSFLDQRSQYKKQMFKHPKGSELFERYNLLQQLSKIDSNGVYGVLGLYTSLLYNVNVATSITAQGRTMVSSMCMQFEMFLNDNVQFGSVSEVLQFIDHVCEERRERHYNDHEVLDNFYAITEADVFYKLVKNCTWRWIPDEKELEIIWTVVSNLDQENLNRVWYKNNLYEFCENSKVFNRIRTILKKLKRPLFNSLDIPEEVAPEMAEFGALLKEYVYYKYQIIDRVDHCDAMMKSVVMVLDTDSNIVSLDAWYRFVSEKVSGEEFNIAGYEIPYTFFAQPKDMQDEEWDKMNSRWKDESVSKSDIMCPIRFLEGSNYDYNFETDEIVEMDHFNHPEVITANDNMRFSIMNILAYVLDIVVNEYMAEVCRNNNSVFKDPNDPTKEYRKCRIIAKNEFKRIYIGRIIM